VVTSLKVGGGQQTDSGSHERQVPGVDGEAGVDSKVDPNQRQWNT
jgi:hypothetical protein